MQMVAFRTPQASVTPPTAPTNVTATTVSASQINLSWTASSSSVGIANYIVQRCLGAGCTNFAQVGTPTGTTFNDNALSPRTSYSYQVQAKDTSGNLSAFSNTSSASATAQSSGSACNALRAYSRRGLEISRSTSARVNFSTRTAAPRSSFVLISAYSATRQQTANGPRSRPCWYTWMGVGETAQGVSIRLRSTRIASRRP